MRRLVFVALGALLGCHTHEVGRADKAPEAQGEASHAVHLDVSSGRPVHATPSGYLSRDSIVKIQRALVVKGEHVPATGKLDATTQAALKRFQKSQHQPDTGYPDFGTLDRLGLKATDLYR